MMRKSYYLIGAAWSTFGDGCQQIAMMWLIYQATGSALSIGVMIAVYYLPSLLLTPILSVFVDQKDAKKLVIATDSLRFIMIGGVSVLLFLGSNSIAVLYMVQFFSALCYTLYKPAVMSFVKEAFIDRDLKFVMAKTVSLNGLANILGLGIAGVLIGAVSPAYCFAINATSFLVPVILFSSIKRVCQKSVMQGRVRYLLKLREGYGFVRREKGMSYLFFLSIINSVGIQMSATIFLPIAKDLHGGSALYSAFEVAFAVGGIISGLLVTYLMERWQYKLIYMTMMGMMLLALLMGLSRERLTMVILIFLFGYFVMSHLVVTQTWIQMKSPIDMVGRITGLRTMIASLVKIASALSTGLFISHIGIHNILFLFALFLLLSLISGKRIRELDDR
ncbi:hypothetical protein GCM10011391_01440 [Pullulanibacillus camelliae]|uniref:MFS transporter n=1 Tax=Pullulanibacillus camelliae TaxID=1707096 RepID=A0A8J2VKE2_9BACL|nr:MFS transporter [Pullulanibacillus camelliae]GGE26810.1 hypothetical protein GCM10011391_01440 [Pullulanibacillus camelliae]